MTAPTAQRPSVQSDLDPALAELAEAYGVAIEYDDQLGRPVQVSADTVKAVLTALDVDVSSDEAIPRAARAKALEQWQRTLPICVVARAGEPTEVRVVVDDGSGAVSATVHLEDGARLELAVDGGAIKGGSTRQIDGVTRTARALLLPADLPVGYHRMSAAGAEAPLIVTPRSLEPPRVGDRGWGFWLQLYAVRSKDSWGMGELADLADLAEWAGRDLGADFVVVNPLHAPEPVPPVSPSPYLPMSRRFASPLYLRVEDLAEYSELDDDQRATVERLAEQCRARNTTDEQLDRNTVWTAKREALELLHAAPRSPARQKAYDHYCRREGQGLTDFATWCALVEAHSDTAGFSWRQWPEHLQNPRSEAVAQERERLRARVDFYSWVQWVLDEQLAATSRRASEAGMAIGIMHDLAVGVSPDGADAWANQNVLAAGMSVGAPPDEFNQMGQDWAQPPWRPDRLAQTGYAPYRELLHTLLRHSGGLRVDHILGLFRLWWVPQGLGPAHGTYVRYDPEALVGILALEAQRAGAVVVGEDLGTVDPAVRPFLAERGVFGTSLLWFENDDDGGPLPPEEWRELSLATVTTHDFPPTAGYLAGEHLRVRNELGLLARPYDEERTNDEAARIAWLQMLQDRGWLAPERADDVDAQVLGLHRLVGATPARLVAVGLPDAAGDRRIINQPGTSDEYPNWRLPMADPSGKPVLLEELQSSDRVRDLAQAVATRPPTASSAPGTDKLNP